MNILDYKSFRQDLRKTFEKGAFHLLISMGISQLLLFLLGVFVARLLGPTDFGHIRVINAVLLLAAIPAALGMPSAIAKYVAEIPGEANKNQVLSTGLSFGVLTSLITSIGLFIISEYSGFINDAIARKYIAIICWTLPFTVISGNIISYFQGLKQIKRMAFWNCFMALGRLTLIICLTDFFLLKGYIAGRFLYEILSGLLLLWIIKKVFLFSWNQDLFRKMFKLSSFAFLGLAFATLTLTVDTLCLSAILKNPAIVGQYGIAVTLAMGLMLIPRAISQTSLPYLSEQCRDRRRIRQLSFYLILRVGVIMLVVGIFTFTLAPWFIPLLFGIKYLPAVTPFRILIPGIFFYSLLNISGTTLLALGRTDFNFYVTIIAGSLNIVLNIVFIRRYGMMGAAYATSLTYVLRLLLSFIFLFGKELNLPKLKVS